MLRFAYNTNRKPLSARVIAALCTMQKMNELKLAWERYLTDLNKESLLTAIEKHSITLPRDQAYPFLHRICDIEIDSRFFRVVRAADEDETVYIVQCETPSIDRPGVPYWLKGEKLRLWIDLELGNEENEDYDSESETNWEVFR